MKQALRFFFILFGMLVILLVLAMIVLPRFMDAQRVRDRVAATVLEHTGRQLDVAGDARVSAFPWLGVSLNHVSLGGPPGLEEETFARADRLQLRAKLLPLLWGRMDLDRIVVHGLDLSFVRTEDGRVNWKFTQPMTWEESAVPDALPLGELSEEPPFAALAPLTVGGIQIVDGSVRLTDLEKGRSFRLHHLHVESSQVFEQEPFDFSMSFHFESHRPAAKGDVSLVTRGRVEQGGQRIAFHPLRLDLRANGEMFARELSDGRLESNAVVDLVREKVSMEDLQVHFFDTRLGGRLELTGFSAMPAVRLDLAGEELDLDRLGKVLGHHEEHVDGVDGSQGEEVLRTESSESVPSRSGSGGIPWAGLLAVELDGDVRVDRVKLQGGDFEEVRVVVSGKDGILRLDPVQARLYDGQMESSLILDARGAELEVQGAKRLSRVQLGALLRDLAGRENVSGTGELSLDLGSRGNDLEALLSSLRGNMAFMVRDGVLHGVNIPRLIQDAYALLRGQGGLGGEMGEEHTEFSQMSGSYTVRQGIARSEDLVLLSPLVTLRGNMEADLPRSRMDARTRVRVTEAFRARDGSRVEDMVRLEIPLRISGPLDNLRYSLDVEALGRDLLRQRGREILERFMPTEEDRERPALEDPFRRLFRQ